MPAIDLVFKKPWKSGNPVDLVFGDDDGGSGIPDRALLVEARMPGLRGRGLVHVRKELVAAGRMPGVRGRGALRYNTDTARPLVAKVVTNAQDAQGLGMAFEASWQATQALPATWSTPAQEAESVRQRVGFSWQDAQRTALALVSQAQQAQSLQTAPMLMRWQDGLRMRNAVRAVFEDAVGVQMGLELRFEDALRDRRLLVRTKAQEATGLQMGIKTSAGLAVPLYLARQVRCQQAMHPPAGRSESKTPEPECKGCYEQLLGGPIELVFCKPWSASADLVFFCCKSSSPEPGGQFVIPLLKVYMLVYQSNAVLIPSGERVVLSGVRIESSDDGFGWSLSASGPVDLVEQLAPRGGLQQQIRITINDIDWVFTVKRPVRTRSFEGWQASVSGQSVTSLLGAPYRKSQQWGINSTMTAQQIAIDALQYSGVELEWSAVDWQVPAAAWSHEGTPLSVVMRIAEAAGAVVRSHRTNPVLQVVPQYGALPWAWASATPDVQMPGQIILQDTLTDLEQQVRNAVYVSGASAGGVVGLVVRAGTAGELLAQQITDPLMTDVQAVRQRGSVPLADASLRWRQEISVPLITGGAAPGLILPGHLIEVKEPGETWRGLVRHLSLQENMPEFTQTLTVDRYQ